MMTWRIWDYVAAFGAAAAAGVCLAVFLATGCPAEGHTDQEILRVSDAVQILQPATRDDRARMLAGHFLDAAAENWIDPLLLVALSMRESSLLERADTGEYSGALGEAGLLQVHGVALRHRPSDCDLPLIGARCQVHTGARFLGYVRALCEGSMWRWVAAYGMSQCPSEESARADPGTRLARRYYQEINGLDW